MFGKLSWREKINIFQPLTGAESIVNYSLDIFRRANIKWNNYLLSILVQIGFIIGYFISAFLMSRIKRKVQYVSTAILMAMSQTILGFTLIADVSKLDSQKEKNSSHFKNFVKLKTDFALLRNKMSMLDEIT